MKEKVEIKVGNDTLVGALFYPDKKHVYPGIIFLNGRRGVKERFFDVAENLLDIQYVSLCFDFRGRGESTLEQIPPFFYQFEDIRAVIGFLTNQKFVDKKHITLVGTSMGGYVVASVASTEESVRRVVLMDPSIFLTSAESKPFLDISVDDVTAVTQNDAFNETRSVKSLSSFKGELYVVRHKKSKYLDDLAPVIQAYYDSAENASKRVLIDLPVEHAVFKSVEGRKKVSKLLIEILTRERK